VETGDSVKARLHKQAVGQVKACEALFQDFAVRVYGHTQSKHQERGGEPSRSAANGNEPGDRPHMTRLYPIRLVI